MTYKWRPAVWEAEIDGATLSVERLGARSYWWVVSTPTSSKSEYRATMDAAMRAAERALERMKEGLDGKR